MNRIRVTQIRSRIGQRQNQRECLWGLGLRKIDSVVELPNTPEVRGLLRKVMHLVKIEEIEKEADVSA